MEKPNIYVEDGAIPPSRATPGSSGFDLSANINEELIIQAGNSKIIPTGVFLKLNIGEEAQVRSRSGLAAKYNVFVLNSPGTIDSDYRGEVKVILFNAGKSNFVVNKGDRIAQLVFADVYGYKGTQNEGRVSDINLITKEELNNTNRGAGGFGSTGLNESGKI